MTIYILNSLDRLRVLIKLVFVSIIIFPVSLIAQQNNEAEKQLNIFTLGDSNGTFPYSGQSKFN